jgi:hypothetical protein
MAKRGGRPTRGLSPHLARWGARPSHRHCDFLRFRRDPQPHCQLFCRCEGATVTRWLGNTTALHRFQSRGRALWAIYIGCPKNASYELRNCGGCGRFVQGMTEIEAERGAKCKMATKAASHRRAALVGFKQRNVCFHNHRLQRFRTRQHRRWRHAGKDGAFMCNHNSYLERGRQTRSSGLGVSSDMAAPSRWPGCV